MAKCFKCGKAAKARLADARVCPDCWYQAGMKKSDVGFATGLIQNPMKSSEFGERLDTEIKALRDAESFIRNDSMISLQSFGFIGFNDDAQKIILKMHHPDVSHIYGYRIFDYDQLVDADVVEKNSVSVSSRGGLGRAVVGGLLFGGVGAIVGAATAGHTTSVTANQDLVIYFETSEGAEQHFRVPGNQEALRKIRCILEPRVASENQVTNVTSEIEALLKLKELMDSGVITENEFQQKKAQILGI